MEGSTDVEYIAPLLSKKQCISSDPTINTNILDILCYNFQQLTLPVPILFFQFNNMVATSGLPFLSIIQTIQLTFNCVTVCIIINLLGKSQSESKLINSADSEAKDIHYICAYI